MTDCCAPDSFAGIFFDEAQEHLCGTEAVLLRMDIGAPLPEDLNAVFRAVHSIKGSAAMLGFDAIAALAHVMESLLDLLRKGERPLAKDDVDALLKACDTVRAQLDHDRGLVKVRPDGAAAEAMLRARLDLRGAAGEPAAPAAKRFNVRLGPLAAPIETQELEMMLAGLAEMGAVENQSLDNACGGFVAFDAVLDATEFDLRSVLSLVVAPGQIAIAAAAGAGTLRTPAAAPAQAPVHAMPEAGARDEFFVDPAEFKRRRGQVRTAAPGEAVKRIAADAASIRVATDKVDLLVNLVGELIITESMLASQCTLGELDGPQAALGLADLASHTRNLQEAVLAIRMVPISNVFARFPRFARALAEQMGKRVDLVTCGESTELDRGLIEQISDPLMHLVRNAIDHGLEPPEGRCAAGKPAVGRV